MGGDWDPSRLLSCAILGRLRTQRSPWPAASKGCPESLANPPFWAVELRFCPMPAWEWRLGPFLAWDGTQLPRPETRNLGISSAQARAWRATIFFRVSKGFRAEYAAESLARGKAHPWLVPAREGRVDLEQSATSPDSHFDHAHLAPLGAAGNFRT